VPRRPAAGLADGRVQPEIADQVARRRKPTDVADHGDQRAGRDHIDAGNRHQPPHVFVDDRQPGDQAIDGRQLVAEEIQLAQAAVDRQALVERELLAGQPLAALGAE
jgi:hypothetical protein